MGSAHHDDPANAAFDQTTNAFITTTLPGILAPLTAHIRSLHRCVARTGIFLTDSSGTRLRAWADSDGRVMPCPPALEALSESGAMTRCRRRGAPVMGALEEDHMVEWASDGTTVALAILPVRDQHNHFGYMVIEAHRHSQARRPPARTLLAWAPLAATALCCGIKSMHMLVGTVRFARDFTLMRDHETGRHQLRLGTYLSILAEELDHAHGLPGGLAEQIMLFGPLHDIGKIGVADDILLKPGKFDQAEWQRMQAHVNNGSKLVQQMSDDLDLEGTPGLETLKAAVAHHHEYLDGSGYPDGRTRDEIPLAARMVTVTDIFDALTCIRPYKRSWSIDEAYDYVEGLSGDKIDRECVAALGYARPRITRAWLAHAQAAATT